MRIDALFGGFTSLTAAPPVRVADWSRWAKCNISTAAEIPSRKLTASVTQRSKLPALPATLCPRDSLPAHSKPVRMSCKALAITALLCIAFGAALAGEADFVVLLPSLRCSLLLRVPASASASASACSRSSAQLRAAPVHPTHRCLYLPQIASKRPAALFMQAASSCKSASPTRPTAQVQFFCFQTNHQWC